MSIKIRATDYAQGVIPWFPYKGGFLGSLCKYHSTTFYWVGYAFDVKI